MADEEPPPPEPAPGPPPPLPVLPYSPRTGGEFGPSLPPAHQVYVQFGQLAFGLSLVSVGTVLGAAAGTKVWGGNTGSMTSAINFGCCCGSLTWVMSVTLALTVALRDSPARVWAVLTLLIDALLFGLVWVFGFS